MTEITISSGFGRGGRALKWDGQKFNIVCQVSENTWHDDGDDTQSFRVENGGKYAVVTYRTDGHTPVYSVRLIGWTDEELAAPSPVTGWVTETVSAHAVRSVDLETVGHWLTALAKGDQITTVADMDGKTHPVSGNKLVELDYEWGCQAAAHYIVVSPDGEIVANAGGIGDRTPEPFEGVADWEFDSQAERDWRTERVEQAAIDAALAKGEQHDGGETARHLRYCYRNQQNPLPGLRRRFGGEWKWHATWDSITADCAVIFRETPKQWGSGWVVIWTPAK